MNNIDPLKNHAMAEFIAAGWIDKHGRFHDDMQAAICNHVLQLLEVFSKEGHSGTSAQYSIDLFARLAKFEPLAPLTGEDWEWRELNYGVEPSWQNIRASHVFKDADGSVYDINGIVFWEWQRRPLEEGEEGYPGLKDYKTFYTCRESRVPVTFPYTVPKEPQYVYRYSGAGEPAAPAQTEQGIL